MIDTFADGVRWAESLNVVLPAEYYGEKHLEHQAHSFTVSRLRESAQIEAVKRAAMKALVDGETLAEFKKRISDSIAGGALTEAHQETVFRNFVQSSYGQGRLTAQMNNDRLPILVYDAINDARTRPEHGKMDGFMAHRDDPIWAVWYPPNGHNCRCDVYAISISAARSRGYKGEGSSSPAVAPDLGWDHDPDKGHADKLRDLVASSKALSDKTKAKTQAVLNSAKADNWTPLENGLFRAPTGVHYLVRSPLQIDEAKRISLESNFTWIVVVIAGVVGIATEAEHDV